MNQGAFEYKFSNSKRLPCLRCGSSRGWAPVKGYEGSQEFGYCHSCGDVNFPNSNKHLSNGLRENERIMNMRTYEAPKKIDKAIMEKTLKNYEQNPFATFLSATFGKYAAEDALFYWRVGTAKHAGTVFWYIDEKGFVRQPKVVYYGDNGRRKKDRPPLVPQGYTANDGYSACLFGAFQLWAQAEADVMLVESEKTAIFGKLVAPDNVWLATGGANGLTETKARELRGRNVLIICDNDKAGRHSARASAERLKNLNCQVGIMDKFKGKEQGYDLADYIIDALNNGACMMDLQTNPTYQSVNPYQENYIPF